MQVLTGADALPVAFIRRFGERSFAAVATFRQPATEAQRGRSAPPEWLASAVDG